MINRILVIFFSAFIFTFFSSCKTDNTTNDTPEKTVVAGAYNSIPKATMQKLWDNCTLVDYIFHDLPFSMSQTEINSIRSTINYIGVEAQETIPAGSKAICRQIWQIDGEVILEVDVHYGDLGNFFVFIENNKPVYANKMTDGGVGFFGQVIRQAMSQVK